MIYIYKDNLESIVYKSAYVFDTNFFKSIKQKLNMLLFLETR